MPTSRGARFRLIAREEGYFPCVIWKEFPAFPSHLKRRRNHRKGERNSRVLPPFPESPRCLSPFQGNLFSLHCIDIQAEDRLTTRWHVREPCGKASCESLVGKPRAKDPDFSIHAKGRVTLLLHLGRKAHVYAPNRDEDLCLWGDYRSPEDPCRLWRGILRFRH